jgi:hypothetical protein
MSPQLTKQQLEHAIENLQKRVDAKKLECDSYAKFHSYSGDAVRWFARLMYSLDPGGFESEPEILGEATTNLFTAKLNLGLIELEELELTLRAYKQMSSGIVGATLIPPTNRMQH